MKCTVAASGSPHVSGLAKQNSAPGVKEEQERRCRERAHAALRWKIQPQRSSSAALVHRGDCALYPAEGGFLNREEAMIALAEPDIEACQICKPETGLVDG
ncbi:DUF6233 domain-containing protein [Streptomyces sp. NPDC056255]|uniref:DUF6233 domain-containing protein n=1 Tax=Streptomyces sp. NPDC056255 TaxID=3345764 RepID=UPI0035DDE36F